MASPQQNSTTAPQAFAIDFATLAREIAQDILEIDDILKLHRLTDEEWQRIQTHPRFVSILNDMQREWNSAANTRERIKIKAQTGLETQLETFITDIGDPMIPLAQRIDAGRFLARLGEVDGQGKGLVDGEKFSITLNIGTLHREVEVKPASPSAELKTIEHLP